MQSKVAEPEVIITEQPAPRSLRFRYKCEGRCGILPGIHSTQDNRTFPSIKINNYNGTAKVVISCVEKNGRKAKIGTNQIQTVYLPHPHSLVGRDECKDGVCTLSLIGETVTPISNLGIQCVKKNEIEEALALRMRKNVDPSNTGFYLKNSPDSSMIDLSCVRLCFQVYLESPTGELRPLKPVVSDPIYDKKAWSDLKICGLSDCSAKVDENRKIILLCEKVAAEDVEVRFFEERDGALVWQGLGEFLPADVHKQVAIFFRTPNYGNTDIIDPVKVQLQLRRRSDRAVSESLDFTFTPSDAAWLQRKRFKYDQDLSLQKQFQTVLCKDNERIQNTDRKLQMVKPNRDQCLASPAPNHGINLTYSEPYSGLPLPMQHNSLTPTNQTSQPQAISYVPNIPYPMSSTEPFALTYDNPDRSTNNWNQEIQTAFPCSNVSPQAGIDPAGNLMGVVATASQCDDIPAHQELTRMDTAELDRIIYTARPDEAELQDLSCSMNTLSF